MVINYDMRERERKVYNMHRLVDKPHTKETPLPLWNYFRNCIIIVTTVNLNIQNRADLLQVIYRKLSSHHIYICIKYMDTTIINCTHNINGHYYCYEHHIIIITCSYLPLLLLLLLLLLLPLLSKCM